MTLALADAQRVDIERQIAAWPECPRCRQDFDRMVTGETHRCSGGRVARPVILIAEGVPCDVVGTRCRTHRGPVIQRGGLCVRDGTGPPAGWRQVGAVRESVQLTTACGYCKRQRAKAIPLIGFTCPAGCVDSQLRWGSATAQSVPVASEMGIVDHACLIVVSARYVRQWYECEPDATHDRWMHRQVAFDVATPVPRPGVDFGLILTNIERRANPEVELDGG